MKTLKRESFFYYGLLMFAVALPFSIALISLSAVLLLLFSFVDFSRDRFKANFYERKYLLFFVAIYLLHVLGMVFCKDFAAGLYDLNKALPFLLAPLAFLFGTKITKGQFRIVLNVFSWAIFFSALITLTKFYQGGDQLLLDAQFTGYIHHIRFSLMIVLALAIQIYLLPSSLVRAERLTIIVVAAMLFLVYFLFWQQSLTGLLTFWSLLCFSLIIFFYKKASTKYRIAGTVVLSLLMLLPADYVYRVISDFYNVDEIKRDDLPLVTNQGNSYVHDFSNPFTENGHWLGLYVCEPELRDAWNKRSSLEYDGVDGNGYRVKDTLIRYLTSRNLRKDANGVAQLTDDEIKLVEAGTSNYILATRKTSLYPRLYVSVWELDQYLKTGNADNKSIAQRIEYFRAAWAIWQKHFWFGVGTGNWKDAYKNAYQEMGSQMDESQYADAHNQYMAWLVRFGFVGTALILFLLFWPVLRIKVGSYPLLAAFVFILIVSNLGDSNLDTHVGGYFFLLFYCLFLTHREYLKPGALRRKSN